MRRRGHWPLVTSLLALVAGCAGPTPADEKHPKIAALIALMADAAPPTTRPGETSSSYNASIALNPPSGTFAHYRRGFQYSIDYDWDKLDRATTVMLVKVVREEERIR